MLSVAGRRLAHGGFLSDTDLARVDGVLKDVRPVSRGVDIIREGDVPDVVHVVMQGLAFRYKLLPDGGRQILALMTPGDFGDMHGQILGRMDHGIGALSPCRIAYVPANEMLALTRHSLQLTQAFWWSTLVDSSVVREWLVGMGRRPANRRIAHLMCELLCRMRAVGLAPNNCFEFIVTQDELSDITGMSAVHVNRVLQQLRARDLIEFDGRSLTVLDEDQLAIFAEFNPNYLHLKRIILDSLSLQAELKIQSK